MCIGYSIRESTGREPHGHDHTCKLTCKSVSTPPQLGDICRPCFRPCESPPGFLTPAVRATNCATPRVYKARQYPPNDNLVEKTRWVLSRYNHGSIAIELPNDTYSDYHYRQMIAGHSLLYLDTKKIYNAGIEVKKQCCKCRNKQYQSKYYKETELFKLSHKSLYGFRCKGV